MKDEIVKSMGCALLAFETWGGGGCSCQASLASHQQGLIIWDFRASLTSPVKHVIQKSTFNAILPTNNQMDSSEPADDLMGGDVDGELIIRFQRKWLRWNGGTLSSVHSWEVITLGQSQNNDGHSPIACSGDLAEKTAASGYKLGGAGSALVTLNGASYFAAFRVDEPCYTLRRATYNGATKTLTIGCDLIKRCTPGGQLLDDGEHWKTGPRSLQTITEGTDGKVYMTSVHIDGHTTRVMSSSA
jgi:hypothetical protein